MKKYFRFLMIFIAVILLAYIFINYYSFIFSKTVKGEIVEVQRVTQTEAILGGRPIDASQLYSFAVAIREEKTGLIFTSSTEDRQWAVAKKGFCVTAKYYPYPFWELDKAGTYFNARLVELKDCNHVSDPLAPAPGGLPTEAATPAPTATASP